MYTLYSSVNFDTGSSKNLPEISSKNVYEIAMAITKMVENNTDLNAINFTFTLVVNEKEPEIEIISK